MDKRHFLTSASLTDAHNALRALETISAVLSRPKIGPKRRLAVIRQIITKEEARWNGADANELNKLPICLESIGIR